MNIKEEAFTIAPMGMNFPKNPDERFAFTGKQMVFIIGWAGYL